MGGMPPLPIIPPGRHATLDAVPGRGNPRRGIRIEAPLWERFGTAAAERGRDRAGLIRDFVRWFVARPTHVLRLLDEWHAQAPPDNGDEGREPR